MGIIDVTFCMKIPLSEVDEETLGGFGDAHVVEELGTVIADELAYGFQLDNDSIAVEVGLIDLLHLLAFVVGMEELFALEGDGTEGKLDGEGFLVDGLIHAVA